MTEFLNTFPFSVWTAVAQALLYGLLLTAAVHIALRLLMPANASTRFAVWFSTLIVVAVLPLAMLIGLLDLRTREDAPVPVKRTVVAAVPSPRATLAVAHEEPVPARPVPERRPFEARIPLKSDVALFFLLVWAAGSVVLLGRIGASYARIRRLKARAAAAPVEVMKHFEHWMSLAPTRRPVQMLLSSKSRSPIAVGFRNPAIILAESMLLNLTGDELDHLGLHELAHVRRYDDYTNLVERIIEAMLFFHPAVWWIRRKLEFEREVACDDQVLAVTGAPKPYAQVLSRVLETASWRRGPVLAAGVGFRKSQIFRRIELMLDRTRDATPAVSGLTVAAVVICLFGAATEFVKMSPFLTFERAFGANQRSVWRIDGRTIEMESRGDVQFGDDDVSIRSISSGGYFRLRELSWTRRELNFRATESDRLEMQYLVDGRERPLDAAGKAWADSMFGFLVREGGIHAERRALRILDTRGVAGLFNEVDHIQNGWVRQQYLSVAIRSGKLNADELQRAIGRVRWIESDHDKANLLIEVSRDYAPVALQAAYFDVVNTIQSDHDRGRVLARAIQDASDNSVFTYIADSARKMSSDHDKAELLRLPAVQNAITDESARRAIVRAAMTIQSAHDKARVVSAMLEGRSLDAAQLEDVLRLASGIGSDHDKSQMLSLAAARQSFEAPAVQTAFYAAANTVQSDADRARLLSVMADRDLPGGIGDQLAQCIREIHSDHDKAGVLLKLAAKPATPAYVEAVRSLNSDHDKSRVIQAMLERGNSVASALELTTTIASDHDKSQLLTTIASRHGGDPAIHDALRRAAEKLASDTDYRRIMSKL